MINAENVSLQVSNAGSWNLWTVLGTAAVGALVALLVEFFLKPHLQVRNEKASQRAKDRMGIIQATRSIMIQMQLAFPLASKNSAEGGTEQSKRFAEKVDLHNERCKMKLDKLIEEFQEAYEAAAPKLPAPVVRLIETSGGILQGLLLADSDVDMIKETSLRQFQLLYEVLMTSKWQVFTYIPRIKHVVTFNGAESLESQTAALEGYFSSRYGPGR